MEFNSRKVTKDFGTVRQERLPLKDGWSIRDTSNECQYGVGVFAKLTLNGFSDPNKFSVKDESIVFASVYMVSMATRLFSQMGSEGKW